MPNAGSEDLKRAAFGALKLLKDNLPAHSKLSVAREDEVVISALSRHGIHLSTHAIDQAHLDPFKLLCWIGCAIIDGIEDETYYQHGAVLDSLINSLEEVLVLETGQSVLLESGDRELLKRFIMEELKGNGDHGIGFNGLFIAFHCLRSTYLQMQGQPA
jgi:hypothetical protein